MDNSYLNRHHLIRILDIPIIEMMLDQIIPLLKNLPCLTHLDSEHEIDDYDDNNDIDMSRFLEDHVHMVCRSLGGVLDMLKDHGTVSEGLVHVIGNVDFNPWL
ncbi:hypothetical protein FBU59_001513 [Linderina macrospora]|uniref:Uncharacterized protein n=1 Tax=Linderina macrospora TaxID=4868 RepID=A0ACC1JDN4_9FUNG|nr:hypothetical protein FBU59_001513 [Linderina macrospora]